MSLDIVNNLHRLLLHKLYTFKHPLSLCMNYSVYNGIRFWTPKLMFSRHSAMAPATLTNCLTVRHFVTTEREDKSRDSGCSVGHSSHQGAYSLRCILRGTHPVRPHTRCRIPQGHGRSALICTDIFCALTLHPQWLLQVSPPVQLIHSNFLNTY